jgi:hypothetical protein
MSYQPLQGDEQPGCGRAVGAGSRWSSLESRWLETCCHSLHLPFPEPGHVVLNDDGSFLSTKGRKATHSVPLFSSRNSDTLFSPNPSGKL